MENRLIRNACIIDGSGSEPFNGDVLVAGGTIAAIGRFDPPEGCEIIDAAGRCLTPGFVDIHRHADLRAFFPEFGEAELRQGITSCVSGNCGMSAAPCPPGGEGRLYGYLEPCLGKPPEGSGFAAFADYTGALCVKSLPLNMGAYVGSGAVRIAVKGFDPSVMTAAELDCAKGYVAEAMQSGALGLSMGLMYAPECNYTEAELIEISQVAARYGGLLAVHIRGEGGSLVTSIEEVLRIAESSGARLQVSHFKAAGRSNWGGKLNRAMERIEAARARGLDVCCDAYPYAAGSTMLMTLLPPALLSSGMAGALNNLKSCATRNRLRAELSQNHADWDNLVLDLGWENAVISSVGSPENASLIGHSVAAIAAAEGRDEVDCLCDILISEQGRAGMVLHSMSEDDVTRVLRLPYCAVASDSIYPPAGNPHPRLYGAFPRVIRKLVLEKKALTLPEAVRKMTSLPASRAGMKGRGLIRAGYAADLLLFRPEDVCDSATYENPASPGTGMGLVMIGGRVAARDDIVHNKDCGKLMERQEM